MNTIIFPIQEKEIVKVYQYLKTKKPPKTIAEEGFRGVPARFQLLNLLKDINEVAEFIEFAKVL